MISPGTIAHSTSLYTLAHIRCILRDRDPLQLSATHRHLLVQSCLLVNLTTLTAIQACLIVHFYLLFSVGETNHQFNLLVLYHHTAGFGPLPPPLTRHATLALPLLCRASPVTLREQPEGTDALPV